MADFLMLNFENTILPPPNIHHGTIMLSKMLTLLVLASCVGCANYNMSNSPQGNNDDVAAPPVIQPACLGNSELPDNIKNDFSAASDEALLQRSLGAPNKGKLCQGQVYKANDDAKVIVYRLWNSTNPNSQMGSWWAAKQPQGKVASYRENYEICYQWSPLDKITRCTLKAGSVVVIGTGQSATCSEYLSYPASAEKQIYLENASDAMSDCTVQDAVLSFQ
jgi:hypothetical protein